MIFARMIGYGFARASALAASIVRPDVLFMGYSITQFWSAADPWLFRPVRINAGISGHTTVEMRARFEADVIARRPRVVHIMAGTNDLWFGDPGEGALASLGNIAAMVESARAAGIAVILAPPTPIARRAAHQFAHLDQADALHNGIAEIARANGCGFVDYAESLLAAGELAARFTTDGIHLSRAGYRAIRMQAERAIQEALSRQGEGWVSSIG